MAISEQDKAESTLSIKIFIGSERAAAIRFALKPKAKLRRIPDKCKRRPQFYFYGLKGLWGPVPARNDSFSP